MNSEIHSILYTLPENAPPDVEDLTELEDREIPWERVPRIKEIMHGCTDLYDSLRAAFLLANWGEEEGINYLESFVCDLPPRENPVMPHRLEGYDDVYTQVLRALVAYWAARADAGSGDEARARISKTVLRIIHYSNTMPFAIDPLFWIVQDRGFEEYVPALKEHLTEIVKEPKFNHWRIADCAKLLAKFDPSFVERTLALHGKSMSDFPAV